MAEDNLNIGGRRERSCGCVVMKMENGTLAMVDFCDKHAKVHEQDKHEWENEPAIRKPMHQNLR